MKVADGGDEGADISVCRSFIVCIYICSYVS